VPPIQFINLFTYLH